MSKIQIDKELFEDLLIYFDLQEQEDLTEDEQIDLYYKIRRQLQEKQDKIQQREAYTQYRRAETATEREEGRQAYLDAKGVSESYRWSQRCEDMIRSSAENMKAGIVSNPIDLTDL